MVLALLSDPKKILGAVLVVGVLLAIIAYAISKAPVLTGLLAGTAFGGMAASLFSGGFGGGGSGGLLGSIGEKLGFGKKNKDGDDKNKKNDVDDGKNKKNNNNRKPKRPAPRPPSRRPSFPLGRGKRRRF